MMSWYGENIIGSHYIGVAGYRLTTIRACERATTTIRMDGME